MSRCFPFPPPGYEKKTRSDHLDLLAEEKRKEKKHKKEKRDKEKKEGKEKKDRDRSKDKHKEKKDRKEKHKDKKKKDKDKDKSRPPNDRPEKQSQLPQGDVLGECSRKTEETKKFSEELERRIKDDEKVAANRKFENFNGPNQKSIGSLGVATTMARERAANDKIFPPSTGIPQRRIDNSEKPGEKFSTSSQRRNEGTVSANAVQKERNTGDRLPSKLANAGKRGNGGMPLPMENSMGSLHRGSEGPSANTVQKERSTSDKMVPRLISTGQRGNGGISLPMENSVGSLHGGPDGPSNSNAGEIDNFKTNKVASNSNKAVQRTINGMGQSAQSLSAQKHLNSFGLSTKMEDRGEANKSISNHDHMVARRIDGTSRPVEKDADNRSVEEKAKNKEREERHKDRDHDQKKIKDKDKHKGKEKEKAIVKEKGVKKHKEQNEPKEDRNKGRLDSIKLKPLSPETDNAKNNLIDGNSKKRKEIDINGLINENNLRLNKIPRTNSSTQLLEENGKTLESSHIATAFPSVKPEANNSALPKKTVDRKEHMTNGIAEAQPSSAGLAHSAAADTDATIKFHKSPHPDAMHLDQIYSIPKMEEWNENDDQEWLFSSSHLHQKPNPKLAGNEVPQVWSKALKIDSEDVVALPYVIPY